VHWPFAEVFMPDYHTDLHFAKTLLKVHNDVDIIPVSVRWNEDLSLATGVRILPIPWEYIEREAKDRGSYLLVLRLSQDKKINVGKLGSIVFKKGFYVYVGSAMVSLTARIERHQRLRKNFHWHIDSLRDVSEVVGVFSIRSSDRLECELAHAMSGIAEWTVQGFGSSDCTCPTHLFGFKNDPASLTVFQRLLQYFRMDRYGTRAGQARRAGKQRKK
jgi:sugar fermentation stimulation protein A